MVQTNVLKRFATGTTFYVQPMPMARRPGQSALDVLYRDDEVAHRWVGEERVVGYLFDIKVWFFGAFSCSEYSVLSDKALLLVFESRSQYLRQSRFWAR